jgi:glycosyltransferase involved in cell wall biosynthesis
LSRDLPNAHFVIAGIDTSPKGEVRTELKRLVVQLQLQNRVHFLGWLDDAEHLLFALDVFVSASETESFGLAIAEAMTAQTAVVSTATEGASEVVVDDETGFLVPIGDVNELAHGIATLLRDDEKRTAFGLRGREVIEERFSLERMVDEIERLYREVVS